MKNGIIIEINNHFLTILTPEGEFLQAQKQNQSYQIGQEINFYPLENEKKNKRFIFSFPGKLSLSVCAFILAILSIIPVYQSNQVYAYMSIDINPSIELGINENLKVIELISYNEDGERIITALHDWKRKDIDEVTFAIMKEIKKQGYTKNNHEVVLSTVMIQEQQKENNKKLENELKGIEKEIAKENLDIIVVEASEKDREKALEKGLTTGLYKENYSNKIKKDVKRESDQKVESVKQEENQNPTIDYQPTPQEKQQIPNEKQDVSIPPGQANKIEKNNNNGQSDSVRNNENSSNKEEKKEVKIEEKAQNKIENNSLKDQKQIQQQNQNQNQKQNQSQNNGNQGNQDKNDNQKDRQEDKQNKVDQKVNHDKDKQKDK